MTNTIPVGVELFVDSNRADFAGIARKADAADKAINGIVDSAARAERALSGIDGNVGVTVNTDFDSVIRALAEIDSLSQTEDVTVDTDTSKLETAQTDIDALSQAEEVSVDAKTTDVDAAIKEIGGKLDTLRNLAIIDIVMNLPAGFTENPVFAAISDTEAAVDRITAATGRDIPNAAGIISSVYSQAFGATREEIAAVITDLARLNLSGTELADATQAVFQTAAVTGEDPLALITSMNALVGNELVGSFREAGDFITKGFQDGLNVSGDFLDSINEYSQGLADAGLGAGAFFSIFDDGLESGARDTDKLIDAFKEMNNLTREEVSRFTSFGEETDRTRALQELGLIDEAQAYAAGEITGEQYGAGVLDALRAQEDVAKQREQALAIFGPTQVEEAGLPNLLAIDLENSSELQEAWQGVAADAATTLTDNLNGALAQFVALVETELVGALDDAFDLTERMDTAKQQFKDFIAAIREGKTAGEAIEIAFGVEGVDTALANIERVFGNLLIGILEAVAFIQDPTGTTDADKGTRAEIARLAEGQLAFDLQVANADEIPALISQALERGVGTEAAGNAVITAINEALASGNIEAAAALSRAFENNDQPIVVRGVEFDPGTSRQDIIDHFFRGWSSDSNAVQELTAELDKVLFVSAENASPALNQAMEDAAIAARAAFFEAMEAGNVGEALNLAAALDDPAMISRASQAANELFLAAQDAYANYDFSTLSLIADQLQDPTLQAQAQELGTFIADQARIALSEGDLNVAKRLAADLGDPALMAEIENFKNTNKTAMQTVRNESQINLSAVREELGFTDDTLAESESVIVRWKDTYIEMINLVGERIKYVSEQFMSLNNQAGATSGGTGGTGDGGTATGRRLVGEEGPEIATFPAPAGIINAANSSLIMKALGTIMADLGVRGSQTIINNNFNMPVTNHMQNQAQADAFGYRAGSTLRGF